MPREFKAPLRAPEVQRNVSWRQEQGTVTFSLETAPSQTSHGYLETPIGSPQRCSETTGLSPLQKALWSSWRRNKHGALTGTRSWRVHAGDLPEGSRNNKNVAVSKRRTVFHLELCPCPQSQPPLWRRRHLQTPSLS